MWALALLLVLLAAACSRGNQEASAAVSGTAPPRVDEYVGSSTMRIHCVVRGEGPLILFLHGFPEFWYEWKDQLAEFGKDHMAVAPDMRGYNLSTKPDDLEQYRMSYLVEDVREIAEHYSKDTKFVLVGHDWGGAVAWAFAIEHPDYLEKLVIINAPHPGVFERLLAGDEAQQKASQYMLTYRRPDAEDMLAEKENAMLEKLVLEPGLDNGVFTEEDRSAYLRAWSQPDALTGGLNYFRANRIGPPAPGQKDDKTSTGNFAVNPKSLTVNVPTLVIWGAKDDQYLPQNLDGLSKYVPHLTIQRVPDASHWIVHEKPDEVNRYIREFLR